MVARLWVEAPRYYFKVTLFCGVVVGRVEDISNPIKEDGVASTSGTSRTLRPLGMDGLRKLSGVKTKLVLFSSMDDGSADAASVTVCGGIAFTCH